MDISNFSLETLKALAYDMIVVRDNAQSSLNYINTRIAELSKQPAQTDSTEIPVETPTNTEVSSPVVEDVPAVADVPAPVDTSVETPTEITPL